MVRNRWVTAVGSLVFVAMVSGCSVLPDKNIHTEIVIDARPEIVWAVLVDNANYPEWNPYHVRVEGRLVEGEALLVELHKPNGKQLEIEPRVLRVDPYRELTWGGGIRGIFFGEHRFLLEPAASEKTRLVHSETFAGIAVPFAELDAIEEGYRKMNRALKKRVETGK